MAPWLEALAECGLKAAEFTRARNLDESLPWEHLESGVKRQFLERERQKAYAGQTTEDCRYGKCGNCGVCDTGASFSLLRGKPKSELEEEFKRRLNFYARDQNQPEKDIETSSIKISSRETPPDLRGQLKQKAAQYRLWHAKKGNFAWLSQLELQAVIERALRRAKIPLAFSQGFHPLPLLSFGRALPVGLESEAEWFAVTLNTFQNPFNLKKIINKFLSPDLCLSSIELADKQHRTEQSVAETFSIVFNDNASICEAARRFGDFAAKEEYEYSKTTKKGVKTENLRPYLLEWQISQRQASCSLIFSLDWLTGYISPLTLLRQILTLEAHAPVKYDRFIKTGQRFADGREYGQMLHR